MNMYVQLFVSFLPLLVATIAMMLIAKFRNAAQQQQQQQQLQPQQAPAQPLLAQQPQVPTDMNDMPALEPIGAAGVAATDGPVATASANIAEGDALPLRFLHGERAPVSYTCNKRMLIRDLKAELLPVLRLPVGPAAPRLLLIVLGASLRDDARLQDYPNLEPDNIVHVHAVPSPAMEMQQQHQHQHQQQQQQPPQVWNGYPGAAPEGMLRRAAPVDLPQILLPAANMHVGVGGGVGVRLAVGPNGMQVVNGNLRLFVPADIFSRVATLCMTALCGSAWGIVLAAGTDILNDSSFFGLVALTGCVFVAIGRAAGGH